MNSFKHPLSIYVTCTTKLVLATNITPTKIVTWWILDLGKSLKTNWNVLFFQTFWETSHSLHFPIPKSPPFSKGKPLRFPVKSSTSGVCFKRSQPAMDANSSSVQGSGAWRRWWNFFPKDHRGPSFRGAKWMGVGVPKTATPLGFKHHPLEGVGSYFENQWYRIPKYRFIQVHSPWKMEDWVINLGLVEFSEKKNRVN